MEEKPHSFVQRFVTFLGVILQGLKDGLIRPEHVGFAIVIVLLSSIMSVVMTVLNSDTVRNDLPLHPLFVVIGGILLLIGAYMLYLYLSVSYLWKLLSFQGFPVEPLTLKKAVHAIGYKIYLVLIIFFLWYHPLTRLVPFFYFGGLLVLSLLRISGVLDMIGFPAVFFLLYSVFFFMYLVGGMVVYMLLVIWHSTRLLFAVPIYLLPGQTFGSATDESWKLTEPYQGELYIIQLIFSVLSFAVVVGSGVMLWIVGFIELMSKGEISLFSLLSINAMRGVFDGIVVILVIIGTFALFGWIAKKQERWLKIMKESGLGSPGIKTPEENIR